jgi:uncharacterized repeat protein (TIGR01451 family)
MKNINLVLLIALLLACNIDVKANDTLVKFGQNLATAPAWRYLGGGTNLDAVAWKALAYGEPSWLTGNSALGFGTNPPVRNTAIPENTTAGGGGASGARYSTMYFRKVVNIPSTAPYVSFDIRTKFDDAIIVWVNGVEVYRNNIATTPALYATWADAAIANNGADIFSVTLPVTSFISGNNIIAVEIHQANITSSDLFFDLELIGNSTPPPPPPSSFILRPFTQRYNNPSVKGGIVYVSNSIISTTGIGAGSPGTGEVPPGGTTVNGAAGINIDVDNSLVNIIPFLTSWKYKDDNTRPVNWETTSYSDAAWATGTLTTANRDFGYGDGDEQVCVFYGSGYAGCPASPVPACNPTPAGCNNKSITTLFRKQFTVTGLSNYVGFQLNMHRDDGAVIYINGIEVGRTNMPSGTINNSTLALIAVDGSVGVTSEDTVININTAAFLEGANTIAVEIHQANVTSSDVSFRLEMNGINSQGTFNSSTSDLTVASVPACSEILFAGLYWGAGEGASAPTGPWIVGQNTCKFKIPGASAYTTVTSSQTDFWNPTLIPGYAHNGYQCFADVTSLLNTTSPTGTYSVGNVVSPLGLADAYGGWTLVLAFSNPSLAPRNLSVFDGTAIVKSGSGNVDVAINGFLTPPTGTPSCELGAVVYDGDRVSQDAFAFKQNGAASFYDLTPTATNPTSNLNDMWNSVIAYKGNVVTTRNPAFQNTLGYDANIIDVPNALKAQLSNNQSGATVRFSSPSENYIVHVLTTSISQYAPIFSFDKTATDRSGGTLTPGDSIRYQINYNNVGNDASTGSQIIDNIPAGSSYIPNSLRINGLAKTDAVGDDEAEYDFVNNRVVLRLGAGATGSVGGTIPNSGFGASGNVSFDVVVSSACNILSCVGDIKNSARIAYSGFTSGLSEIDSSGVNTAGCIIRNPVRNTVVGVCFVPGDTLVINRCVITSVVLPWRKYAGYTFYKAQPFIPSNIANPYLPISVSGTYWAYFNNSAGCSDTIKIFVILTPCPDIDDDNDGLPDYVEFNNPLALQDHNSNGIPNWKDVAYVPYVDNNSDGVNDHFDYGADADNDGILNFYDTDFAGYVDTNGDFVNDNADRDLDGIPNQFDLDSDNDGIPDVVEAYGVDANGDGIIDNFTDTDSDGLSQNVDANNTGVTGSGNGLGVLDFDGDGIANYLDTDSDNDGIPDVIEVGGTDANNDGKIDGLVDSDADGFDDNVDGDVGNDGVAENTANALLTTGTDVLPVDGRADNYPNKNLDRDARPNVFDIDSDGDGITDVREAGLPDIVAPFGIVDGVVGTNGWSTTVSVMPALNLRNTDASGNPDYLDIDADDDGIPDNIEGQPTATYQLPGSADTDLDGLENTYDNLVGIGGTGNGFYDNEVDGTPDYRDLDTDNDGFLDVVEGNDFNLNGLADDVVTLTGIDTDGDGLDNRFDSLTSVINIKGTSYRMGNNGIFIGDPAPGARCPVQRTLAIYPDRDWRYLDPCITATTNYAITPQTGSINWNALGWSLGHVPTCCESAHITYTGTNVGVDAVTVNITNDICIRNLTLLNTATSATNKIFKTIVAPGYNMVMNGYVRMTASGALTSDSCIFITNGGGTITVNGNTTIGYPTDNAYCIFGAAPTIASNENYILKGDSLTFNNKGLSSDRFITVKMQPLVDTAYLVNNTNVSPYPFAVTFENLVFGDAVRNTTFVIAGSNQNSYINDRAGSLDITTNSTLFMPANYTINAKGPTSTLYVRSNGTLKLDGVSGGKIGSNFPSAFDTYNLHENSTVFFCGAAQTMPGTGNNVNAYGNIVLCGTGVKSGAASSTVNIMGDLYRAAGTHTFDANGGRITFSSSTKAQKYYAAAGTTPISFYNFTNNNTHTGGLTIDSSIAILNELELLPSTKFILNNGDVTMRSTAARTSHITNLGTVSVPTIVYNANNRFVIERYLFARKAWRYLATPLQQVGVDATAATIAASWRENNSAFTTSGYGVNITGPTGPSIASPSGELDLYSQRGSMKYYDDANNNFIEIANTSTTKINNSKGYFIFVRGDRGAPNTTAGAGTETNLRIKGKINIGNQPFSVLPNKFQSIGNPFAAQLDFKTVIKNNIASSFIIWKPNNVGLYNVGGYENYILNAGNYWLNGIVGGTMRNNIESGEAFFVQSNSASPGGVTISEADKTTGFNTVSRFGNASHADIVLPTIDMQLYTKIGADTFTLVDGAAVNFDNIYSAGIDNDDARKIVNSFDNLTINSNGKILVVERRPMPTEADSIQLNLTGTRVGAYRLNFDPSLLTNAGVDMFVKDRFLQTTTAINANELLQLPFAITADAASKAADRFVIVFKQGATTDFTTIAAIRNNDKTITVHFGTANEKNVSNYTVEQSNDGTNFTALPSTIAPTSNIGGNPTYTKLDAAASKENNWYRIKINNTNASIKYSSIAMVAALKEDAINIKTSISIYPNPVVNNNVNLFFENSKNGTYNVCIYNSAGQKVNTSILKLQSNYMHSVIKASSLANGHYEAIITNEVGEKTIIPFLVK